MQKKKDLTTPPCQQSHTNLLSSDTVILLNVLKRSLLNKQFLIMRKANMFILFQTSDVHKCEANRRRTGVIFYLVYIELIYI